MLDQYYYYLNKTQSLVVGNIHRIVVKVHCHFVVYIWLLDNRDAHRVSFYTLPCPGLLGQTGQGALQGLYIDLVFGNKIEKLRKILRSFFWLVFVLYVNLFKRMLQDANTIFIWKYLLVNLDRVNPTLVEKKNVER